MMPPENSMTMVKNTIIAPRNGKSFLLSGYAAMNITATDRIVPVIVTPTDTKNARKNANVENTCL